MKKNIIQYDEYKPSKQFSYIQIKITKAKIDLIIQIFFYYTFGKTFSGGIILLTIINLIRGR